MTALAFIRTLFCEVTFAGNLLTDVVSARGSVTADGGWPTCSVFVTAKPATGNEEDDLSVVAGAGNNDTRFTGKLRRFRASSFPKGVELVGEGTLAYAAEWAPDADILFDDIFPTGATDQDLVMHALDQVPGVSYTAGDIDGSGVTLGLEAPEAFDWKAGTKAWQRIQEIDKASLYRTYQDRTGTIRRVQMIGHPNTTAEFTLGAAECLDGSTGERNTQRTRNNVSVKGHDYGLVDGPTLGLSTAAPISGTPDRTEEFSSTLIEGGNDPDGADLGYLGLHAQAIADAILPDVNKEFVDAEILSWVDGTYGPGRTCLLDMLDRLLIGEKMWILGYSWEISDAWTAHFTLTGGGLEQTYTPPDV
jgi:hypothetical protein